MYSLVYTRQFKKDFKKIAKMAVEDILEVGRVIYQLQQGLPLAAKYVDHPLVGNWIGYRDCHIKPDLVLIYRVENGQLQLVRIGSHSLLFN